MLSNTLIKYNAGVYIVDKASLQLAETNVWFISQATNVLKYISIQTFVHYHSYPPKACVMQAKMWIFYHFDGEHE